ncbi:MAG: protein kinase domain-containing protein [Luteolibacter sp.]
MPEKPRSHPNIPDHDVLRKIGGGAYGEVWMARGVTGAMRAVKVVWREDFDDERTFEREFEGILKFEPISRDHPGFVNILHVGRSPDGNSFYYYVMELGDDVHTGQEINAIEYEALTLRADGKAGERWETGLCIEIGIRLSQALQKLHENGLAHRDVKPSNVIFVNGKAKLADIGLVAARDQRTFVGTEGFVPPEGPGSAQADIYSLGKVLYEIATGKDRMDFPELPDELPTGLERKRWLELNRVICDVCEPRVSKRAITTAAELSTALQHIQHGRRRRRRGRSLWVTSLLLLGFAGWASWEGLKDSDLLPWNRSEPMKAVSAEGLVRVVTNPEGAEVYDDDGNLIGITPTENIRAVVGSEVSFEIRKKSYRLLQVSATVTEESLREPMLIFGELQNFTPPVPGEKWEDHLGLTYLPDGDSHVTANYINRRIWHRFLNSSKRSQKNVDYITISENGRPSQVILASRPEMIAFVDWLRGSGIRAGFLTQDNEVFTKVESGFKDPKMSKRAIKEGLKPFRVVVRKYNYGSIQIESEPAGAEVYMNGLSVGDTDELLLIPKARPGAVELLLILEGYKQLTLDAIVKPGENLALSAVLQRNQGVVFGKSWKNSLEMKFEPLGDDLMVSVWETRVKDYEVFVKATKSKRPRQPSFPRNGEHPVNYVSRNKAAAFCKWLTETERANERIGLSHTYRLPTDLEWSQMVGLDSEDGDGPGQRDANKPTLYPWGTTWPPPEGFANYADASAITVPGLSVDRIIPDYEDGFPRTAPVGSFEPNSSGLFDLGGNVHEWVSDDISKTDVTALGVVRGAGWNTYRRESLLVGWRNPVPSSVHSSYYGFRVVLARNDSDEAEE